MNLLIQRDQRRTILGRIRYLLHVTLVCSAEDRAVIGDHRLHRKPLFVVPEKEYLRQRAAAAFQSASNRSVLTSDGASKMFTDHLAGLMHTARASMAFTVTVADALKGTTIFCSDLHELIEAETQITTAFDELYRDVGNALAFSTGREQVFAPDDFPEPPGPPPARWGVRRHVRRHM